MSVFTVIDTETNFRNEVISIGTVIADGKKIIGKRYYILTPYKNYLAMYSGALYAVLPDRECSRGEAVDELKAFFAEYSAGSIFAYNANFDYGMLPEFRSYEWYDIMRIAAYSQFNKKIPDNAELFSTGRLKRGCGVENIYRMLSGNPEYRETHNALLDAEDEFEIMRMLGCPLEEYAVARIRSTIKM